SSDLAPTHQNVRVVWSGRGGQHRKRPPGTAAAVRRDVLDTGPGRVYPRRRLAACPSTPSAERVMRHDSTRPSLPSPLLPAILLLAACGAGERAATDIAVRDSAGIALGEDTAAVWPEGGGWHLSPEPLVEIGVLDGAPEDQLFRVVGARRLGDGRIVVANSGTHELRFYDAQGRHLRSVGREGEGPGEFRGLGA